MHLEQHGKLRSLASHHLRCSGGKRVPVPQCDRRSGSTISTEEIARTVLCYAAFVPIYVTVCSPFSRGEVKELSEEAIMSVL